jgi:hypothetical protein
VYGTDSLLPTSISDLATVMKGHVIGTASEIDSFRELLTAHDRPNDGECAGSKKIGAY